MSNLDMKFAGLGADNAPGQEVRQNADDLKSVMRGDVLTGRAVDFSHGDVDAFAPAPGARDAWERGYEVGGAQAYTEYRGDADIRADVAKSLLAFTGAPVGHVDELIITPGTQRPVPCVGRSCGARHQGCHHGTGLFRQPQIGAVLWWRDHAHPVELPRYGCAERT